MPDRGDCPASRSSLPPHLFSAIVACYGSTTPPPRKQREKKEKEKKKHLFLPRPAAFHYICGILR